MESKKSGWNSGCISNTNQCFIVRADEKRAAFLELLHALLSAQIRIGHAIVWMRIKICVSFILRPSLLPFGFAPWFARPTRDIHWIADAHRGDGKRLLVRFLKGNPRALHYALAG